MAKLPLILVCLGLLVAGCVTPPGDDQGDGGNSTGPDGEMAALPAPIEVTEDVPPSTVLPPDPAGAGVGAPPCESPTQTCFRYAFQLNRTASLTAELTWGVPANDLDLWVFEDGAPTEVVSGAAPPGTSEMIDGAELDAGSYELVVAAYASGPDTFTLSATFS